MPKSDLTVAAVAFLGLGAFGAWYLWPTVSTAQGVVVDGPGPNLEITIEGKANGKVVIDLLPEIAPKHVEQITTLAKQGAYNNVVFHRVIEGFMAQTGDVENGIAGGDLSRAGTGGSELPDIEAEFSPMPFDRGIVGMARANSPDSANSQFFIMFEEGYFLNNDYTVFGRVLEGMDVVDQIQLGEGSGGAVANPDVMTSVVVVE
jgi:peptidylprolyl isomerase